MDGSVEHKETAPIKIDKIHFLIHPGFVNYVREEFRADTGPSSALLEKYVDQSRKLGPNELMLVFPYTNSAEFRRDVIKGERYAKTLREMKRILGRRMVVVTWELDIWNSPKELQKALELVSGRGYQFDNDVDTYAYGETIGICVRAGAKNINRTAGFNKRTVVLAQLTDLPFDTPKYRDNFRRFISEEQHDENIIIDENF